MVDCRSLIEFCRTFEQRRQTANLQASLENRISQAHSRNRKVKSLNPLFHPFCQHSPLAAMDVVMLLLVLGSIGVLTVPYFKLIYREAFEFFQLAVDIMGVVFFQAFAVHAAGFVLMLITAVVLWEVIHHQFRKCGNPKCRGLRKAVEFDIQLESEECVRFLPPLQKDAYVAQPLELGEGHKELEAELKKMAPINGRTVLVFRAPCGCPASRMEVWGPRKVRRIKKIWMKFFLQYNLPQLQASIFISEYTRYYLLSVQIFQTCRLSRSFHCDDNSLMAR
ncbi:Uncharacterized protein AXF42_Ash008041 [Apostasia shenzhenica]|uniref:Ribosomal protein L34e superfamily protein n=1 Tax=Apostasia shenzhenica TaxID=1088818 RepID=A0A2I0A8E0_9ASPA|nr:Uncharacterized protein AXF42_Ash008041 [Apostasia shenzhenica]